MRNGSRVLNAGHPGRTYSRPVDLSDASCEYPAVGVLATVSPSSCPN